MTNELEEALKGKVDKFLETGFICKTQYLVWVFISIFVPKSNKNGKLARILQI